jgi:hypothetical protein
VRGLGENSSRTKSSVSRVRAEFGRKAFADPTRRLAAAPAQWPLVILYILFGARLRMAEQMQHVHLRPHRRTLTQSEFATCAATLHELIACPVYPRAFDVHKRKT